MKHQEFESPEELRDTIHSFWYAQMDFGEVESSFEVMPDGYTEIIFYFGNTFSMSINGSFQTLPSPFMVGLLNQPVYFYAKNKLDIIGIKCFPWTVFDLLGLTSAKDGVRIFEHPIAELQSALNALVEAGSIDEAVRYLKNYFLQMRAGVAANSMLYKAGVAMRNTNGTLPVSGIAAAAHATIRTLERTFKKSSGYTVKDVSALIRFEQVRNHLWMEPDCNLAGVAHELGYTDQSHLSREFKRYSGVTPSAFAREAKKSKQSLNNDFVAFIQD